MNNHSEIVSFCWSVADLIRDTFKRGKYQDVILPLTVLRRLDCVLEPTKPAVLEKNQQFKDQLDNLDPLLRSASGFAFYNTSLYDFERLLADAPNLASNLRAYIRGFSPNMQDVIEKFDFDNTISKLDDAGLLFLVLESFKKIDLHPERISNLAMGYIFEELIRKFNEATNENPGEHFTPREVIQLMVNLLLAHDEAMLKQAHIVRTIYDPCCGTGGMLTIAKERILEINPQADVHIYGQEVNPETYAVCKSDLYIKSEDGRDAENIAFGTVLANDQHADKHFNYLLANPPYGKDWKRDKAAVQKEAGRVGSRFAAGTPRISDGQLLFLQHLLSRMHTAADGGSRVAIVMNGSPLFTGDAGSGESEIRRWILENDWLETIVALPEQLFYNTGIATYVWILSNRKTSLRKGKVQLIDGTAAWVPMRKSLGDKRREISVDHIAQLTEQALNFNTEAATSKIFKTTDFGYRKITIERPLRLNFQASPERIERVQTEKAFINLAASKKKQPEVKEKEEAAGRDLQMSLIAALKTMPAETLYKERASFETVLSNALKEANLKLSAGLQKAILNALSERDETAEICRDKQDNPEADSHLRDTENVPLAEDITDYFEREVKPHVPNAWINTTIRDEKDQQVGKVGYEINFNRYFYQYQPPRPLAAIEADIKTLEQEILELLSEVTR
ncbi:MAG: class I SAM-dependent DNA methyltransferase [Chloroflexota bacterium]